MFAADAVRGLLALAEDSDPRRALCDFGNYCYVVVVALVGLHLVLGRMPVIGKHLSSALLVPCRATMCVLCHTKLADYLIFAASDIASHNWSSPYLTSSSLCWLLFWTTCVAGLHSNVEPKPQLARRRAPVAEVIPPDTLDDNPTAPG
ncbi:hypothetical protein JKP88DRAFT_315717 [Tribonema minus]|uniref:Uncharacterized protein n=1 Tax=Tribonema minus TaxID=303371 RepID=A0A835Z0L0_9STRA|nr:hypothetical protein JKP88DRAFT_315717 [Tribonema minus]